MEDLLERPVGMAQESGVLSRVDSCPRAGADRPDGSVADVRGLLERGLCCDVTRAVELVEVGGAGVAAGVKALPQQREGLGAVQPPGVDSSAA